VVKYSSVKKRELEAEKLAKEKGKKKVVKGVVWVKKKPAPEPPACKAIESTDKASANKQLRDFSRSDLYYVKEAIDNGADVNVVGGSGWTPLMHATDGGNKEIVEYLLTVPGIRINAQSEFGWTALMLAAWNDNKELVKLLIEKGADANIKTEGNGEQGNTALTFARNRSHNEIVEFLVAHGAKE
jgi:ankyrin repeat protein